MFWKSKREKWAIRKQFFKPLFELENEISAIRSRGDVIVICPQNTGYNWLGVLNATLGLFPMQTLVLPQYYSNSVFNQSELNDLAKAISAKKFQNIIFSGFPEYFETLIRPLGKNNNCHVFYHGFLAELAGNKIQQESLKLIFDLSRENLLRSVAFNKKGLSETFSPLIKIKTYHLFLKTPVLAVPEDKFSKMDGKVHIGVLVNNTFRKNPHNQVAAALTIPNSIVHCSSKMEYDCFGHEEKIVENPAVLEHKQYLSLLGAMDVNTHVTFAESWGQVITESLMLEVPCLASSNSGVFDFDSELGKLLIVKEFDNSAAIAEQIKRVLPFKEEIGRKGREYVLKLNKMADERLAEWLND